ncbi:MAG: LON peptidase substrate-binding domain-containing protein [Chthoniobacterales bacterium]
METTHTCPTEMPVMVLPEVSLFPNALLPLHIFEPRYREMLAYTLEHERIFAMAMPHDTQENAIFDIAGAGLIRACVKNEDGTSNLILQGIHRVMFTGWKQLKPFRIATVQALESHEKLTPETADLRAEVQQACLQLQENGFKFPPQFEPYFHQNTDADIFSDVISSVAINDPQRRQSLLEELSVTRRLKSLLTFLNSELQN